MTLRWLSLIGKLVILIVLAKFLTAEEVTQYGLVAATVGYASFIVGWEFYTYSTRKIPSVSSIEQRKIIGNQIVVVLLSQLILCSVLSFLYIFNFPIKNLMVMVIVLTLFEHWSQELYRVLIALSKPILASVVLFLRQGLWVYFAILCFYLLPELRNVEFILICWTFGLILSAGLGFLFIVTQVGLPSVGDVSSSWIRSGIPVALFMFGAAIGLRSLSVVDRYFQLYFGDHTSLAAFLLFYGITISLVGVLDAGIFSFKAPDIIVAGRENDNIKMRRILKQMTIYTVFSSMVYLFFIWIFEKIGIPYLGLDTYAKFSGILYLLHFAVLFNLGSMIFNYGLFALRKDKQILVSHFLTIICFLCLILVLRGFQHYTVPLALVFSFFFLMVLKGTLFVRYTSLNGG